MVDLRISALLLVASCGSTAPGAAQLDQQAASSELGMCEYPSGVAKQTDAATSGCSAGPPGQICQVSNGATIDEDGGVTGGTKSCKSMCSNAQYEFTCRSAGAGSPIPDPMASLGCEIIPVPTPSNVLFYCCPCS